MEGDGGARAREGGIANDFTSSCGTWLELEEREEEGEEEREGGREEQWQRKQNGL